MIKTIFLSSTIFCAVFLKVMFFINCKIKSHKYSNYNIGGKRIIYCHLSDDKSHKKIHDDIFEIVYINMDYFEDIWYHGGIEKENPFLMLLAAPTEKQMEKISKGDKIMEELNDKVKKLNEDPDILDIIIEDEDEIIANSLFEKGISQGVSQGIEQRNIEIAKKMLEEESNIDFQSNWIIKACDKRY